MTATDDDATPATAQETANPPDDSPGDGGAASPGWLRALIAAAVVLALLLVGAAAGILLTQAREPAASAAPAPDTVDVGFLQDMTVHHRQAVLMASMARERSTDNDIRTLAFDIESTQLEQIGRMQGWLSLWGRDPLPNDGYMAWMGRDSEHHSSMSPMPSGAVDHMPGMATQDELDELAGLEGTAFDVRFLQLMLRHHQGGIPMLDFAGQRAEVGVVRNLAQQAANAQTYESEALTAMIVKRGGQPLPPPS